MPFIKIYIHLVFSTLDRKPLLDSSDVRIKLWKHIKQNATEKGIFIDMINGYSDHCHSNDDSSSDSSGCDSSSND